MSTSSLHYVMYFPSVQMNLEKILIIFVKSEWAGFKLSSSLFMITFKALLLLGVQFQANCMPLKYQIIDQDFP